MNYAIDKFSGGLIEAKDALPFKKKYRCPICQADCHLRRGYNRKPHFAHDSGKASENCENYYPSESILKSINFISWSERRRLPSLYMSLEDLPIYNSPRWKLQLHIPESLGGTGRLEIYDGFYGTLTIPVSSLTQGGKRVHVLPKTTYQLNAVGSIDTTYLNMVQKPIIGLDKRQCNVFNFSSLGGRKLDESQTLLWGQAYYLVWHKDFEWPWSPRKGSISIKELSPYLDWYCLIIELPKNEDYQIKKWVEKTLHRDIIKPPLKLSVISPIEIRRWDDGTVMLPSDEVILGLTGENDGQKIELCVQSPNGLTDLIAINTEKLPSLISIGKLPLGRTEIWFSDKPDIGLSIISVNVDTVFRPQEIKLNFKQEQREIIVAPAHSILAKEYFEAEKSESITLDSLSIPLGVPVIIRIRSLKEKKWQDKKLKVANTDNIDKRLLLHKKFERRIYQTIIDNKASSTEQLEIDFGHFGKIRLEPRSTKPKIYKLSQMSRREFEWILSLLNVGNHGYISSGEGKKRLDKWIRQIPIEQYALEDRLIFYRLIKCKFIPVNIETHLRNIVEQISREYSQYSSS